MSGVEIEIIRRTDDAFVPAEMLLGLAPEDLLLIDKEWASEKSRILQELLKHTNPRNEKPQSLHWDWSRKSSALRLLAASGFGVTADGKWQGVMMTKTGLDSRHPNSTGKPIVYIDYLETAPWNWNLNKIGQIGTYRSVGSILFRQSVIQSKKESFRGRIGLHSLPQSVNFYESLGMENLGPDPSKQNLPYFELTEASALKFLSEKGDSDE